MKMTKDDKNNPLDEIVNAPMQGIGDISPEIISAIKAQVVFEMQDDDKRKKEEDKIRRETERKEHDNYIAKMKDSPDPWVEIEGWAETEEGVKVELEWNDSFVEHLKNNGISGSDDDQIVQKWIVLLMKDMSEKMSEETETKSEYD